MVLLLVLLVNVPSLAQDAAERRAIVERVLARDEYQTELPRGEAWQGSRTEIEQRPRPASPRSRSDVDLDLGLLPRILMWILIGVLVLVGLFWLARSISTAPRERAGRARSAPPVTPPPAIVDPGRADELARAGRHGEAVHLLLLAALDRLARRPDAAPRSSWTSREVLAHLAVTPLQTPLTELVETAERFLFAGADLGGTDYEAARASYANFEQALSEGRS